MNIQILSTIYLVQLRLFAFRNHFATNLRYRFNLIKAWRKNAISNEVGRQCTWTRWRRNKRRLSIVLCDTIIPYVFFEMIMKLFDSALIELIGPYPYSILFLCVSLIQNSFWLLFDIILTSRLFLYDFVTLESISILILLAYDLIYILAHKFYLINFCRKQILLTSKLTCESPIT